MCQKKAISCLCSFLQTHQMLYTCRSQKQLNGKCVRDLFMVHICLPHWLSVFFITSVILSLGDKHSGYNCFIFSLAFYQLFAVDMHVNWNVTFVNKVFYGLISLWAENKVLDWIDWWKLDFFNAIIFHHYFKILTFEIKFAKSKSVPKHAPKLAHLKILNSKKPLKSNKTQLTQFISFHFNYRILLILAWIFRHIITRQTQLFTLWHLIKKKREKYD